MLASETVVIAKGVGRGAVYKLLIKRDGPDQQLNPLAQFLQAWQGTHALCKRGTENTALVLLQKCDNADS